MTNKRILLIVGGGIAAYKALELIRLLRKAGLRRHLRPDRRRRRSSSRRCRCRRSARTKVYTELFSLTDESRDGPHPAFAAPPTWSWSRRPPPT